MFKELSQESPKTLPKKRKHTNYNVIRPKLHSNQAQITR